MFKDSKSVYDYVIGEVVRICQSNPHVHTNVRQLTLSSDGVDCEPYDDSSDATFIVQVSDDVFRMLASERHMVCGGLEGNNENLTFGGRELHVVKNRKQYVAVLIQY